MSKRNLFKFVSAILLGSVICGSAFAINFPSFSKSSSSNSGAADQMQGKLVSDFMTGQVAVLQSQALIASALGNKDKAAEFTAVANSLHTGASQDDIGRAISVSKQASADQSKELSAAKKLSAEAKTTMQKAIPNYLVGVAKLIQLRPDCTNFLTSAQKEISSAGLMSAMSVKNKLAVGTYVATNVPGYVKSLAVTTGSFIDYAKSNNIPIPSDAIAVLGSF